MKNKEVSLGIVISSLSLVLGISSVAIGVISLLNRKTEDVAAQRENVNIPIGSLALLRRS